MPFSRIEFRHAQDSDWQPVKDAAKQIAFAEDHAIFHGFTAAGIIGIAPGSSNPALHLPPDVCGAASSMPRCRFGRSTFDSTLDAEPSRNLARFCHDWFPWNLEDEDGGVVT